MPIKKKLEEEKKTVEENKENSDMKVLSETESSKKKTTEKKEVKSKSETKDTDKKKTKKKRVISEKALFPLEDYVKYSCHLGTKAVTPRMRKFVYKRRADGIAVLNTHDIDGNLKKAIEFLSLYNPEDIFIACKREACWKAVNKFSEVTGIRAFTKKYPAGIITNPLLEDFFETELVIICDPWVDKNALNDAVKVKKPVIAICDTNNFTKNITKIIPGNNKIGKSLGVILYLLAKEYLKNKGKKTEVSKLKIEDFTGEKLEDIGEKKVGGAKQGV
jgi:small subunit ribosomal protein S2